MKKLMGITLSIALLALFSGIACAGSGHFYWDGGQSGKQLTIGKNTGASNLKSRGWNDKISSYKIDNDVECVITKDSKFGGSYLYLKAGTNAFQMPSGWNDNVTSVWCKEKDFFTNNNTNYRHGYACFDAHYMGNKIDLMGSTHLSSLGNANDKISSIRLGPGIECNFYPDSNFRGTPLVVGPGESYNRLSNQELNDKISSIQCCPK
jgi:hypothetical protein